MSKCFEQFRGDLFEFCSGKGLLKLKRDGVRVFLVKKGYLKMEGVQLARLLDRRSKICTLTGTSDFVRRGGRSLPEGVMPALDRPLGFVVGQTIRKLSILIDEKLRP